MWSSRALRGLGITTKLIVPFIAIFGLAVAGLGVIFVERQGGALSDALAKKAEILARNLATALGEPFAAGDAGLAQQLLDAAKRSDEDTVYAIALKPDGRVLASTDGSLRSQTLARTELEAGALRASDFTRQATGHPDVFEVAMPISRQGARVGVLRIGVSTHQVQTLARKGAWSVAVVGLIGLGVGGAVYFYVARLVARPLREVVTRLDQLAAGDADLTLRLEVRSFDEVGHLCRALNTFLDNLHQLVGQIRETAHQVGGASRQLSEASTQLSSRVQEQASALEQTAASLEEITGTIKQTADNARQASQLAVGSREAAETGGQVVTTAVTAMSEINRASKKIADIITTIDEIAFQTNLLALNAAVEAARAGEQGRGFAVVAAEVRSLAQRSALAAREIKALIQDSVQKVGDGSSLVNRSGQNLEEIVASVKRVTDIIAEIAAASGEQSQGIDQVNRAVSQMDQVVQSNAANTLELSSTARTLAVQAGELQSLVGRFTLEHGRGWRPAVSSASVPPAGLATPAGNGRRAALEPALVTGGSGNGRGLSKTDGFEEF